MANNGYTYVHGCLVRTGPPRGTNRFVEEYLASGGNLRELERIAQNEFPDARTSSEAMRRLADDVDRAAQHRHSDLFDDPIGLVINEERR